VADVFVEHVGDRSADAWGLLLLLVAVIAGMGTYADAAGPVGAFLAALLRSLVGSPAVLAPVLLAALGLAIVFDRPATELGRVAVGGTLAAFAGIGLWHLARGAPHLSEGAVALHPAGGVLGHVVSRPLVLALSTPGAVAVLVTVMLLGALIGTGSRLSVLLGAVRDWMVAVPRQRPARADEPVTAQAEEPAPSARAGRRSSTPASSTDADDGPDATRVVARRATVSATGEQQVLPGTDDGGLTAADRLAGRAPAPPRPTTPEGVRKATPLKPVEDWADYQLPDLAMLATGKAVGERAQAHIEAQATALGETFEQFGIDATVARWSRGPTVTQFEIELGPGVKVAKVANLGDDIAYALAAPDVRIVAPIPGRSAIGVEVPNRSRDLITLGDILRSDVARNDTNPLFVALGVDIAGNAAMVDLTRMPHLLVAGATGSGKSVTLNAMITSVIMRARPDQVRMILIDPKQVELNAYEGAPHLLTPVVTDARRAADAVAWCVKEMELRYETLARLGHRNIDSYNDAVANGEVEQAVTERYADPEAAEAEATSYRHMPLILLVIDELADLMMVASRDVEDAICRIAQKARAVGIHMVIATQRPSVDVITGLIKANIPSRLALAVSSQTDSRTILDGGGAEKLVGHGDMLFLPASQGKPSRLQGCFVSEREIEPVVEFCKQQRQADFVKGVVATGEKAQEVDAERGTDHDSDEALLVRAADQVVTSGLGSVSMLQRKLRIGFARAGRLMDELEELGVVGENEGSKAREVHWTPEMLDEARSNGLL
jgi:S-DNA-T family DNA segregation ATPase FtsK/SpoIIIE